jgi:hypothetical protein
MKEKIWVAPPLEVSLNTPLCRPRVEHDSIESQYMALEKWF